MAQPGSNVASMQVQCNAIYEGRYGTQTDLSRSILTVLSSYLLGTSLARPVRFGGQLTLSLLSFLRRSSRVRL